jgi:hypothetical protein
LELLNYFNRRLFFDKLLDVGKEKLRKILILSLIMAIPLYFVFMTKYEYYPMTVELYSIDCGPLELCGPAPRILSAFGFIIFLTTLFYISYALVTAYKFVTGKK